MNTISRYFWKALALPEPPECRHVRDRRLPVPCVHCGHDFPSLPCPWHVLEGKRAPATAYLRTPAHHSLRMASVKVEPKTFIITATQVKDFHLAMLVQQRLFYLCVSRPLKILLGHISRELIETLKEEKCLQG